jgi:exonuclease-1
VYVYVSKADAQLAFLSQHGFVDAIITEDSDALVFGCARVLFKLESDGTAQQVMLEDLFTTKLEGGVDMRGWTQDMFQLLCVLGGNCDYIESLPGLGLKTVSAPS